MLAVGAAAGNMVGDTGPGHELPYHLQQACWSSWELSLVIMEIGVNKQFYSSGTKKGQVSQVPQEKWNIVFYQVIKAVVFEGKCAPPWKPETGNRKPESGIQKPESGIQNPESGTVKRNLESRIRNPESGTGNRRPETGNRIQNPESGIHESNKTSSSNSWKYLA